MCYKNQANLKKDPLYVRKPESFQQPRTIPRGWDLSEMLAQEEQIEESESGARQENQEERK